jgi:hypothetical protein
MELNMYVGPGSEKKRNEKASGKLQEQMEKESMRSGDSRINRSTSGAIIRAIVEEEWE